MLSTAWQLWVDFIRLCAGAFNEFLEKNGPYMAAAISFYSLISFIPLVLALLSIFGFLLGSEGLQDKLIREIPKQLPMGEENVKDFLESIANGRFASSVIAPFGLLWASMAVFGAIRKSINIIWGIRKTRPFLQERLIDFLLMVGAALLLLISVFATTFLSLFQEIATIFLPESAPSGDQLWNLLAILLPPISVFFTFLILYTWLPNTRVAVREAWLPALLASIAFNIGTVVFVWWLKTFPAYQHVYATMSTVIALIAWVYISSIIMLSGAMATARYSAFLAVRDQRKHLEHLSKNLERVRSNPVVLAPSEAGAD